MLSKVRESGNGIKAKPTLAIGPSQTDPLLLGIGYLFEDFDLGKTSGQLPAYSPRTATRSTERRLTAEDLLLKNRKCYLCQNNYK